MCDSPIFVIEVFFLSFASWASVNVISADLFNASKLFIIAGPGLADWGAGVLGRGGGAWVAEVLTGIGGVGCAEICEEEEAPLGLATMPAPDVAALIWLSAEVLSRVDDDLAPVGMAVPPLEAAEAESVVRFC